MNEGRPGCLRRLSVLDRRMLAAAYLPLFAFTVVLVAEKITRSRCCPPLEVVP